MTDAEKIEMITVMVDNDPEATPTVLRVYLMQAAQKILDRLYPLNPEMYADGVPEEYAVLHCELSARLFLRRGGEGQQSSSENGIERVWGSPDDEDILSRLTPYAAVVM